LINSDFSISTSFGDIPSILENNSISTNLTVKTITANAYGAYDLNVTLIHPFCIIKDNPASSMYSVEPEVGLPKLTTFNKITENLTLSTGPNQEISPTHSNDITHGPILLFKI